MSIAVIITDRDTDELCGFLNQALPGVRIQQWPRITAPDEVRLAVLWDHPKGITQSFPNLKKVLSMGAGMDHIDADKLINKNIPKDRIVTLVLQQNMAQYVLQHILAEYRHAEEYQMQQLNQQWQVLENNEAPIVGFLGLGKLGGFVADQCQQLGLKTMAWTHSQEHPVHRCFHGTTGLQKVCANSDYLVVLLPLNASTQNIINQKSLAWCQPSCTLINVARGGHVNEHDLLEVLNRGGIKRAVLDVFDKEPLPQDHPFWEHPRITLTPHSSSRSDTKQTAAEIIRHYKSLS